MSNSLKDLLEHMGAANRHQETERQEAVAEIRRRIAAGETTGDSIHDFVLARWPGNVLNRTAESIESSYRTLAERLRGKTGEFVLMIQRDADLPSGCVRFMQPLRESFTIGLLTNETLCLNLRDGEPTWTFPTINSARQGDHQFSLHEEQPIRIEQGGMHPWCESAFFKLMEESVDLRHHEHGGMARFSLGVDLDGPITKLDLFIGNAEIDAWCRRIRADCDLLKVSVKPREMIDIARVHLIRHLAKALGANPKGIRAVQQANEVEHARIKPDLEGCVETLRTANAAIKDIDDPVIGSKIGGKIGAARQAIQRLLKEAEDAGLDDPFYRRLRAAHPAK